MEHIEATFVLSANEADALVEVLDGRRQIVGRYRTTSEPLRITLAEGTYQVRLEKPAFEPFETSLTVSSDEERSLDVTLVAKTSSPPEQVSERKDTASQPSHLPPWNLPPGSPPSAIAPFDAAQAKAYQEAWAKHLGVEVEMENSIGMHFVLIPPGEFDMGSTEEEVAELLEEARATNQPNWYTEVLAAEMRRHRVRITRPFWLGCHEVTRGQFRQFVEDLGYQTEAERDGKGGFGPIEGQGWRHDPRFVWNGELGFQQTDNHPVMNVTWNDAAAFSHWLSEKEGKTYCLPTEAQWEHACRAGTTTRWYGTDDEAAALLEHAWFGWNADQRTHPVGQKTPNIWGVYDMHGNVSEWCADWWDLAYYGNSPLNDPKGPATGSYRVERGGGCNHNAITCRSAFRARTAPAWACFNLGFRVILSPVNRSGQ